MPHSCIESSHYPCITALKGLQSERKIASCSFVRATNLLSSASPDDEVSSSAGDIVPAVQPWQGDLPVDKVGVVEDVAHDVVVVELLGSQHDGHLGVVQLGQNLDEEVLVAGHVRIKDDHKLHMDTTVKCRSQTVSSFVS